MQRWIAFRLRYARGDLFLGPYQHGPSAAVMLAEILARISDRLLQARGAGPPSRPSPAPLAQALLGRNDFAPAQRRPGGSAGIVGHAEGNGPVASVWRLFGVRYQ